MDIKNIAKMLPKSIIRQAVGGISGMLKSLIRDSHTGHALEVGEEDFGLILFQSDKSKPESPLIAVVCTLSEKGEVKRQIHQYVVDDLVDILKNKVA